jgi:EmrB/QacA subfamily drug resistance transporter
VTRKRLILVTLGVMMSLFMASMESTVIATAMPTIVAQLGGLENYSWVFSIYLLTSTTTGPIFGKLSDIFGRRPIYMAAIILFVIGSLLCGIANTMGQLIAARAVQGVGAGGLMPLAFIIVGDIYTLEQRTKVQGLFSGVWGVSSVIGPLIGGFLVDVVSWHWVFLVNIPAAIVAAALVWFGWSGVARPVGARPAIDYAGAGLLIVAVVALLLGLNDLGQTLNQALLGLALAATGALIWVELRAPAPILPLRLLKDRMFAVACIHGALAGWALFGSMSYVPLYVQGVLGTSATEAGSTLTPLLLGWVFTSILASRLLLRVSYRSVAVVGMTGFLVGAVLLTQAPIFGSRLLLMVALTLLGIGMGASIPSFLIAVQASVARNQMGAATASIQFARQIGGTIGVAVLGVVLASQLSANLALAGLSPDAIPIDALLGEGSGEVALPAAARPALAAAIGSIFNLTLGVALFATIAAFFAPKGSITQLRDRREAQEAALSAGD